MLRKLLLLCLTLAGSASASAATYLDFDVPGAQETYPAGINNVGVVAGYYDDSVFSLHGFIRAADGTFTTFDYPSYLFTATAINDSGWVTGWYADATDGMVRGYIRSPDGDLKTIPTDPRVNLSPTGIDDEGDVCGYYFINGGALRQHGFIYTAGGALLSIDIAGTSTTLNGINGPGAVAGNAQAIPSKSHGLMRAPDGTIALFTRPGWRYTTATAINDAGSVAGAFVGDDDLYHGFFRDPAGHLTAFDLSAAADNVGAFGMNAKNAVAGHFYENGFQLAHGFLRKANGNFQLFDAPGANGQTLVAGINDQGVIVGRFYGADQRYHGYLRTP